MDQSGAPVAVRLSCDINTGKNQIRLHELSQVFKNFQYYKTMKIWKIDMKPIEKEYGTTILLGDFSSSL